ncbi:hypothetical protein ACSVIA_01290 [Rhodococcus erythropolis]|uniref:hypothetical protein n=1 Tax=Rhodococcus erythropolis TaxID=1833 RepID=UPI004042C2C6
MLARTKAVWKDLERRNVLSANPIQYVKPFRKKDGVDTYEGALDLSDRLTEKEVARLLELHSKTDLPLSTASVRLSTWPWSMRPWCISR